MSSVKIAVIGLGHRGKKYIQVLEELNVDFIFGTDTDPEITIQSPKILSVDLNDLLTNDEVRMVIIATPEQTHYQLCRQALEHDKDVLLEKPMTHSSIKARELLELAIRKNLILGVAHTPIYTDSFHQLVAEINSGKIGKISRIEAIRTSRGREKSKGVLWDLAGHDIAIGISLFGNPVNINYCINHRHTCYYQMEFSDKLKFYGVAGWTEPPFYRLLRVYSSTGVFEYREPNGTDPLAWSPNYENPLLRMVKEFINCCTRRQQPKSNGKLGYNVVCSLELLSQKMITNYENISNHSGL